MDVLTDAEVVNEDNLFHDRIPNYLSGEVEAHDELSDIEDCNFQLDIDPTVKKKGISNTKQHRKKSENKSEGTETCENKPKYSDIPINVKDEKLDDLKIKFLGL